MAAGNNNSGRNSTAANTAAVSGDTSHITNGIVNTGVVGYGGGGGLKRSLQDNDDKSMGQVGPNDPAKRLNLDPSATNRIKNEPGLGNVEQKYNPLSMINDIKPPVGGLVAPKNEPLDPLKSEPIDTKDGILSNVPAPPGNKQFQSLPGGVNPGNQQLNDELNEIDINNIFDESTDGIMTTGTFIPYQFHYFKVGIAKIATCFLL